jgi:polyisoprenoid-binding protein YceI
MTSTLTPTSRTIDGREVPPAGTYDVDTGHSHVGFAVKHLMVAKTRGRFGDFDAQIVIADDPAASSVEVEVRMASVDTRDEQRDAHLRADDFFGVEQFPAMKYRSTRVTPGSDGHWSVDGELTVRDVTRPVTLDVEFEGGIADPWGNVRAAFSASATIDREDFGLTWNQALEGGGVLVGKKVAIDIEAEAVRRP